MLVEPGDKIQALNDSAAGWQRFWAITTPDSINIISMGMQMTSLAEERTSAPERIDRDSLLDVLLFLERRGASPDVIALAMQRAGIQADVARLLSRCGAATDTPPVIRSCLAPPAPNRTGIAAERALRAVMRLVAIWLVLFGSALMAGTAIGYESGVAAGWEAGMDRFAEMIDRR